PRIEHSGYGRIADRFGCRDPGGAPPARPERHHARPAFPRGLDPCDRRTVMGIASYCHRLRGALIFTVLDLALYGAAMMLCLPVSLFPDVTFPRIVILADNGSEPAERMMVEVTKPLEEVATAIPGVRYVRSTTARGSTEISIGLEWGSNITQTLGLLQGRIAN